MLLIAVGVSGVSGHILRPSVLHSFKGRVVKSLLNGLCLVSHVLLRVVHCSPLCLGYHSTETRAVSLGPEVSRSTIMCIPSGSNQWQGVPGDAGPGAAGQGQCGDQWVSP